MSPVQPGILAAVPRLARYLDFVLDEATGAAAALAAMLAPAFRLQRVLDAFQYDASRDLTGYEDGTENPQGEAASPRRS